MSFYKQVRTFLLKNDPGRVRLSKRIASKFTKKLDQQIVMKRLIEVYKNGGPSNIKIIPAMATPIVSVNNSEEE